MPPSAAPECERVGWIFEIIATSAPASKASIAARMPAQPAPTTSTSCFAITKATLTKGKGPTPGEPSSHGRSRGSRSLSRLARAERGDPPRLRWGRRRVLHLARGSRHEPRRRRRPRPRRLRRLARRPRGAAESSPRPRSAASWPRCAPSSGTRSGLNGFPTPGSAPAAPAACPMLPQPPRSSARSRRSRATGRCRCGTAPWWSSSTRPGCVARRLWASTSGTSTSSRNSCTSAAARAARSASSPRRGGRALARPLSARSAPDARRQRSERRVLPLGARTTPRHEHPAPDRPPPAPAAARLRDAPARRRSRPAHHSGTARPQLALDDPGLQPRRPAPPAPRL